MKAKLIRDMESPNPAFDFEQFGKLGPLYDVPQTIPRPKGTVIDDPVAFRLVQMGVAIPEDDECEKAARRTPEQLKAAQAGYDKLLKGMSTSDYRYDAPADDDEETDELFDDEE